MNQIGPPRYGAHMMMISDTHGIGDDDGTPAFDSSSTAHGLGDHAGA